jgi:hypothetical protein
MFSVDLDLDTHDGKLPCQSIETSLATQCTLKYYMQQLLKKLILTLHVRTNQKSGNLEIRNQQPDTGQKPLLQIYNIYVTRSAHIFREQFTLIGSNGGIKKIVFETFIYP